MSLLEDLSKLLGSTPISSFPLPRVQSDAGVIEISSDANLSDAVSLLQAHNISSCPVRHSTCTDASASFDEAYAGVIDLLDIVSFVVDILKKTERWGRGFETVLEAVDQFGKHTVNDILLKHPVTAFQSVPESASLLDIIKLLGKDGFHRVVIVDSKNRMVNLVTQSAVLAFLVKTLRGNPVFDAFTQRTLSDLGLNTSHPIIGLPISNNAADAFHLINAHRVSGIPVLSSAGSLVGNISARDVRSMVGAPEKFDRLFDTVSEFIVDINEDRQAANANANTNTAPSTPGKHSKAPKPAPVSIPVVQTVARDDSFEFLLHLLAKQRIHRAYVVRGRVTASGEPIREPIGIVTLTDVMRALVSGSMGADNERVAQGANLQYSAK
jgi:CBS domain-containing protein